MQDRPEAAELLDTVAEFLAADLRESVPADKRFLVLVAANLCAVVAREIRAGAAPSRADLALFRELLGTSGPDPDAEQLDAETRAAALELAGRIRAGDFDDRLEEIAEGLAAHVRRKLDVARPGYDTAD